MIEPYIEVYRVTEVEAFGRFMDTLLGCRWCATAHNGNCMSNTFYSYTRARAIKKAARYLNVKRPVKERIALKDLAPVEAAPWVSPNRIETRYGYHAVTDQPPPTRAPEKPPRPRRARREADET